MRVNHGGRVARLLCGLVFVGVGGEVVGAKAVAQSVGFARHFRVFAQFHEMLLERDFVAGPEFAGWIASTDQSWPRQNPCRFPSSLRKNADSERNLQPIFCRISS